MDPQNSGATQDSVEALSAFLDTLDGSPEAGLAELEGKTDPESLAYRLDILLNDNRISQAADLVRGLPPHEYWCSKATLALAANGDTQQAREILAWSKSQMDLNLLTRCSLAYAEGLLIYLRNMNLSLGDLSPASITQDERQALEELLGVLEPILAVVRSSGRIENRLHNRATEAGLVAAYLLCDQQQCDLLSRLLNQMRPVSLMLGRIMLHGGLPPDPELPMRLREDYPGSFWEILLAALIEARVLNQPETAFQSALRLRGLAADAAQKEELFKLLWGLSQELGPETQKVVADLVPELLSAGHPLLKLRDVDQFLREERTEEADRILTEIRDENDPQWLQYEAFCQHQKGDASAAAEYLSKACKRQPGSPDLLRHAATVAFDSGRYDLAVEALDYLQRLTPDDVHVRRNAAIAYIKQEDLAGAARQFAELCRLEPNEPFHAVNQATCLARSGDLERSLGILAEICAHKDPPLEAVRLRAQLLHTRGSPVEGFGLLQPLRDTYWDDSAFLQTYSVLAYASGNDKAGFEAIFHLKQLQDAGKIESKVIEEKSLEDLIGFVREQGERRQELYEHVLRGKMPWLLVDNMLGSSSYWAWCLRTQPLQWTSEHPQNRAAMTVYSTHGFRVGTAVKRMRCLEELCCAPKDSQVVADISSLITLHRLDLLKNVTSYFSRILVPEAYFSLALEEQGKLVPHQLSQDRFYARVRKAMEVGEIQVGDVSDEPSLPYVDAYGETKQGHPPTHCLSDMVDVLHRSGKIDDTAYQEFHKIPNVSGTKEPNQPELKLGQDIIVAISSLNTLHEMGILKAALEGFRVSIMDEAGQEVRQTATAREVKEDVRRWHVDLWIFIRESECFEVIPVPHHKGKKGQQDERDVFIISALLAEQRGLPLLADDRVLQTAAANRKPNGTFGTNNLLEALHENGMLDMQALTDAFVQLMEWRYRFLVPPAEVLKCCAERYKIHPPGRLLMGVARYMHDCLHDPGLFTGMERTTPPMSMAGRLFQAWALLAGSFVMAIWTDSTYDESVAIALTEWAVQELLPSTTRRMGPLGFGLAIKCRVLFMSRAMMESCHCADLPRVTKGFCAIREALGMSETEYVDIVAEVLSRV